MMAKPTKRNKASNVLCQHCGQFTKTRHVEDDIICTHCFKHAKLRGQPTRLMERFDKSNKITVQYYVVLTGCLEKMARKYSKLTESEKQTVNKSNKWIIQTNPENQ